MKTYLAYTLENEDDKELYGFDENPTVSILESIRGQKVVMFLHEGFI